MNNIAYKDSEKILTILYKNAPSLTSSELKETLRLNRLLLRAVFAEDEKLKIITENKLMSLLRKHNLVEAFINDNEEEESTLDSKSMILSDYCREMKSIEGFREVADSYFDLVQDYFEAYSRFVQDYHMYNEETLFHIRRMLKDYRVLLKTKLLSLLENNIEKEIKYIGEENLGRNITLKVEHIIDAVGADEDYNNEIDNILNETYELLDKLEKRYRKKKISDSVLETINLELDEVIEGIKQYNLNRFSWAEDAQVDIEGIKTMFQREDIHFNEHEKAYFKIIIDIHDNSFSLEADTSFRLALVNTIKRMYRVD